MTTNPKKTSFGLPGEYARIRNIVNGDWAAALLLYRMNYRWWTIKKKLQREDREWIAMPRDSWAREAGLTTSEMKNRALKKLRDLEFIEIRSWLLGGKRQVWISMNGDMFQDHLVPWDMYEPGFEGMKVIGKKKVPNYPYKKSHNI